MTKKSIRAGLVRFGAGLHQTEAFLDLAEHKRKLLALLRGEAGQDLMLLAPQPRDQLLVQRLALSCHAEPELAAIVFILDTFHQLPRHQGGDRAAETSAASRFSRNRMNLSRSRLEPLLDALSARQPEAPRPEKAFGKNRSNLS